MRPSFQFIILAALCACTTGLSAQNNPYCCAGYGGLFADSLGISIPEIKQVANIYNTYGNASVRVQLRRPVLQAPAACPLQKRPCVIVVHGGYWAEAGADDAWNTVSNEVSRHLVPAGFITAGVRYRTGVGGGNEVALLLSQPCLMNPVSDVQQAAGKAVADVQMATQYLFDNANALGIDTAQVYYMGYSAGAFNVIQAAYMRKGEQLYGTTLPGCPHVKGVIAFAGGVDQVARLEQTDRKIPLLLLHGAADNTVLPGCGNLSKCSAVSTFQWLVCGSRAVYDRCLQVGIPAELHLACGSDHGLNGLSPAFAPCYVKKWLSERIAGQPAKSAVFYDAAASTSAGGQICAAPVCQAPKVTCPPPVTIGQSTHFSLLEAGNAAPVGMTSAIRATADGKGSLVVGTRSNVNTTRAVVIRTDEQHTPLWTVELGYTAYNNPAQATYGADIVDLGNDQYVLLAALNTAFVNVEAFQNLDYVLVRFSRTTTGTVVHWTKRIGGPFNDVPHQLLRTKDGGLLASGYSNMEQALNLPGKMRTFLVKTDLSGNVLWSKRYQDGSACNTGLYSVAGGFNRRAVLETADGGLVFATPCDERIYLTKTNGSGQVLWNRSFNASGGLANGINLGGLGELSVPAAAVPRIKRLVRGLQYKDAQRLAQEVLTLTDQDAVRKKLLSSKI
jgi:dienelactone hydrolase